MFSTLAVAELLRRKCYTLLATHFLELTEITALYPHAKNVNLRVENDGEAMKYLYRLGDGPSAERDNYYGIHIAAVAAMPSDIISNAKIVSRSTHRSCRFRFTQWSMFVALREKIAQNQAKSLRTSEYHELILVRGEFAGTNTNMYW